MTESELTKRTLIEANQQIDTTYIIFYLMIYGF